MTKDCRRQIRTRQSMFALFASAVLLVQRTNAWWANGHLIGKRFTFSFILLVARIAYDLLD
jgi:hypothetical protein